MYEDLDFWIRLGSRVKVAHSNKVCGTYIRIAPNNARRAHAQKEVYSKTFMSTLAQLIASPDVTAQQVEWIREIRDRRMVPYVFSLLCVKRRKDAQKVLKEWSPVMAYKKYRMCLAIMSYFPYPLISLIQTIRYHVF